MRCYHTKLRSKKNVTLVNGRPVVQIDEYGIFLAQDSDAKAFKNSSPNTIFLEDEKGFIEPVFKVERYSEQYISSLEEKIRSLELEIKSLKKDSEPEKMSSDKVSSEKKKQ
jgi:hypothetical protein